MVEGGLNMKYLITGISGFVGGHFLEYIFRQHPEAEVIGVDAAPAEFDFLKETFQRRISFYRGSLLDKDPISDLVQKIEPDYIVNLASYSSVMHSWKNPADCFVNNTNIF